MSGYRKIVWLASYPKSGNTWVRAFLDAYIFNTININEITSSFSDDIASVHQLGDGHRIQDQPIEVQMMVRPTALLRLISSFNQTAQDFPLFLKTHCPNVNINGQELLPEPITQATVCIIRDPRDILPSFAKHMGVDLDKAVGQMSGKHHMLKSNERSVQTFLGPWGKHVQSFIDDDCRRVKYWLYEDMRVNPVEVFSEILEHAGLPVDADRVKRALDLVELGKLREQEAKHGFAESSPKAKNQFFGRGKVGGWKNVLSPRQIYTIEKQFGTVMKRLGYLQKRRAA